MLLLALYEINFEFSSLIRLQRIKKSPGTETAVQLLKFIDLVLV